MWKQLPPGAARNWGCLAWSTPKGTVQVANIVYERRTRPEVAPAIDAFFKFLEEPKLTVASGYRRVIGIDRTDLADLKQQASNQIEAFIALHRSRDYQIACPDIDSTQFLAQSGQGSTCRFGSHKKTIMAVALHCQVNLRPSATLEKMTKEFYNIASNFGVLSSTFLDEIDRIAPRSRPTNLYVMFYSFTHSVDALNVHGCNEATKAVVVSGLSDYDPGVEIARIEHDIPVKPLVCRRPSVFIFGRLPRVLRV